MFNVELDIFSGRVNPQWQLTKKEADEFLAMIIEDNLSILDPNIVESKLGYRGFIIRATDANAQQLQDNGFPVEFRVNAKLANTNDILGEEWLLNSSDNAGYVPDEVQQVASDEIHQSEQPITDDKPSGENIASCSYSVTSSTNFDFWNADQTHRLNNNCYNYCSNYRTSSFAQPGRGTGQMFSQLTVSNITNAAKRDGYVSSCSGLNLLVALVIWPGYDYHWYRRTQSVNGQSRWCHKAGTTPATNRDNSNQYITSPYSCDRGDYTTWGGYLYSPGTARTTVY